MKKKRQFISLPFKVMEVMEVMVKSFYILVDMSEAFDSFDRKEFNPHRGFDPEHVFVAHMSFVRLWFSLS